MNDVQSNYVLMYSAIIKHCEDHSSVWSANLPFTQALSRFKSVYSDIKQLSLLQIRNDSNLTGTKRTERRRLEGICSELAPMLYTWAHSNGDTYLLVQVNPNKSYYHRLPGQQLVGVAQGLHEKLQAKLQDLAPYGLTEQKLADFEETIEALIAGMDLPIAARTVRAKYTKELAEKMDEARRLLHDQLDRLVVFFTLTDEKFVLAYFHIRKVTKPGHRLMALRGMAVDASTGAALEGVQIAVLPAKVRRTSGRTGAFRVQNLPEGPTVLKASCKGYEPVELNIEKLHGERAEVRIEMRRAG